MIFCANLVGIYIASYINILSFILSGKTVDAKLYRLNILAWEGKRSQSDSKMNWSMQNFHVFPEASVVRKNVTEKGYYKMNIINIFSMLILYGTLFLIHVAAYRNQILTEKAMGVRALIEGGLIFSVVVLIYFIVLHAKPANSRVLIKNQIALDKLCGGDSYSELDLDPSCIRDKNINKAIRATHSCLCCNKALETGNYDLLAAYMYDMDQMLWTYNQYTKNIAYTGCYYHILFFSTYINQNVQNAMKFYNIIRNELERDMDPNGRRVLAYYQYYIMKNPELADKTIREAEAALTNEESLIFSKAELDLERNLIRQLRVNMAYGH